MQVTRLFAEAEIGAGISLAKIAKILWLSASDFHELRAEVDLVLDDGEGNAGELASDDDQGLSGGKAAGEETLVDWAPELGVAGRHGGGVEQSSQLCRAAFTEVASTVQLAGVARARIQPAVGDEGIGVTEGQTSNGVRHAHREQRTEADDGTQMFAR